MNVVSEIDTARTRMSRSSSLPATQRRTATLEDEDDDENEDDWNR
jgi:hypothetical protein